MSRLKKPSWQSSLVASVILLMAVWGNLAEVQGQTRRTRSRTPRARPEVRKTRPKPPPSPEENRWERQKTLTDTLHIRAIRRGDSVVLEVTNRVAHHVTCEISIIPRNLKDPDRKPISLILDPNETRTVKRLDILHQNRPWHYRYQADVMPGILDAKHDDKAVYTLPYKDGTRHRVVQGYGGRVSHQGENKYAIDFSMSRGTRIHAARAGTVAGTKSDSQKSGPTKEFINEANFIIIEHDDGTLGEYAHLKYEGVVVEMGQRVEQGQHIGYSGNTGYSKGPHLHFAIHRVTSAKGSTTIPVKFLTEEGVVHELKPLTSYRAVLPSKAP